MIKLLGILLVVTTSCRSARLSIAASEEVKTETTGGKCSCHCESPKIVRVEVPKIQIKYIPVVVKSIPNHADSPATTSEMPSPPPLTDNEKKNNETPDQRIPGVYDTLAAAGSSRRDTKALGLEYY